MSDATRLAGWIGVTDANRRWYVLVAMGATLGMILLDETVVGVALQTIQTDLDMGVVAGHWVVNSYLLTLAAFVAIGGRLADSHGYRRVFLFGATVFALASLACALATGPAMLIAARSVQGVGAAMVFPLSLALVMISFPEEERGTAIGFYGLVGTAGLTLGPLVGGVFTEYLSWRWIFAINPIVMVAVIFVVATIWREPARPDVRPAVDWRGLAILATALGALVFAIMQASTWGWGAPATVTLIVVGLVALVLFRYVELRTDDPLIDVTLFGRPSFTGANLGVFMAQLSKSTVIVFLPLYLQSVLDFSAIEAGLALMPGMAMNLLLALPGGRLVDRVGPGWPLIVGLGGLVVAHVWIAGAVDIDSYALLLPALLTWGAFTVATFSGSLTAIANSVPVEMQGQAAGISNESQMVGGALGIAVLSAMQTAGRSWTVVFGAVAVVALVVFVIGLRTVDRSRPQVTTMPDVAMA